MIEDLPPPLVPPEVDLRDFGFMPLDVRTLLTSTLWIKAKKDPRVAHAAMSLWCESWHQVPCASLPDDDEVLADLARCDEKEWRRVKERALAHFVKCSDGRLYHRTVAAKAVESWKSKVAQRERTSAATAAREAKRRAQQPPTDEQRDDERHGERDEQRDVSRDVHQGTVKGQGIDTPIAPKGAADGDAGDAHSQTIPCPYDRIVGLYHEVLPALPRAKLMPASRQKALRKVWGWVLSSTKGDGQRRATTTDEALHWLRGYFGRAQANDFLMGRTPRSAEHANWQCDLDFLLTDKGMKQVIEKTQDAA